MLVSTSSIIRYSPPNPIFVASYPPPQQGGAVVKMILAPNGLVYVIQANGMGTFNPSTNQFNYISNWPSGITLGDVWFQGTDLYMCTLAAPHQIVQIDINNLANSVVISPLNGPISSIVYATNVGGSIFMSSYEEIYSYDTTTYTATLLCNLQGLATSFGGMTYAPPGFPDLPCLCLTNAGTLQNQSPLLLCTNQAATVTSSVPPSYVPGDAIRYILFTNPSDTSGSIVATSINPSFSFNPATMQAGILYFMARAVGNMLPNGEVDLTDPCIDFSNALQVVWRLLPTVSLSAANQNICAGECQTITATFTGTPPFNLTYTTPAGTFTQVFSGNTGSFQVCAPAAAAAGALGLQATNLTDAWCTCQ